jgi:undecaprenyl-diphosphatase
LQGPAELLPISSSGHLALVPQLLGWQVAELDASTRKTLEVALHTGSAGALAVLAVQRRMNGHTPWTTTGSVSCAALVRKVGLLGLTFAPPAVAGLLLERRIEERLGGVRTVALAQIAAGAALWLVDRRYGERTEPGVVDHLAVGAGQALALIPGVSRSGAALTAARARGLDRHASVRLSYRAAVPVTLGATLLKGVRAMHGELDPALRLPLAVGAGAALVTGVASAGLADRLERARSLAPLAAYRVILGTAALARRRNRS